LFQKLKNSKSQNLFLNIVGIFLILFGIYAIDYSIWIGEPQWTLWLCYGSMIIMGYGILIRSAYLVMSQLNILTIPLLFWAGDFLYYLVYQSSILHIATYFFEPMAIGAKIISFEHLFLLPLGYLSLWLIGQKSGRAWVLSVIQLFLYFALSRLLTDEQFNINWVYHSPVLYNYFQSWHTIAWFGINIVFIFIVNLGVKLLFWLKKEYDLNIKVITSDV
jgi:hypothetical protein